MGKYFGTDGFRGEANIDLTVEHAYKVGRFLGWYFGKDHKAQIVIGKDTRRSSYMFEYSLVAGLTASGADAYLLHVTTTPSVSYVVRTENFDCGIMISASHNPFYDNGIKVINGLGQKLEADIEAQIEAYIDDGTPKIPFATREDIGRTVDFAAGRNRYIGHLISIPTKSFKNMRVGLDCSNGSASSVAKSVFDAIGAKTYVIHNEPDGTNINCGCGSTHIEELQKYVREKHLDVGFAYDGDADRCIAVDELGNVVDGDLIMYVCGKYLKEKGQLNGDTIVTTIMSNLGLYKACDRAGIRYEKTAVGDKYVCENMMANGYSLGGEQSGHIIFSKHATTGDGILTSLMVMEVLIDKKDSKIFEGVSEKTICWMSHFDYISQIAPGFEITAHTADCPVAAAENTEAGLYAIQYHPEVLHTAEGTKMLSNFVLGVCGCAGDWKMDAFVENTIQEIREKVGDGRVLLALSGGVDSSVAAGLLSRAIGKQLTCVFVDHGLLRKDEGDEVEGVFGPNGQFDLNFIRVNAQQRYYDKLAGVTEPEAKRKIIGEEFIRIFEEEAKKIGAVDFLAQGTIYPDVVESGLGGESGVIKSHHNVGGLPEHVDFKDIIEPLRDLFKDEVRKAGLELGIPERLVFRQPFPGPGLGIRIIGEVTEEKVKIVQDADAIYREEIANAGLDKNINQYFAALTNMRSVGVMGDERTYDYAVALRAVTTVDFMTAEAAEIPYDVLNKVMSRIINEVKGVNRVFYDLTSKPPGTIEFE